MQIVRHFCIRGWTFFISYLSSRDFFLSLFPLHFLFELLINMVVGVILFGLTFITEDIVFNFAWWYKGMQPSALIYFFFSSFLFLHLLTSFSLSPPLTPVSRTSRHHRVLQCSVSARILNDRLLPSFAARRLHAEQDKSMPLKARSNRYFSLFSYSLIFYVFYLIITHNYNCRLGNVDAHRRSTDDYSHYQFCNPLNGPKFNSISFFTFPFFFFFSLYLPIFDCIIYT